MTCVFPGADTEAEAGQHAPAGLSFAPPPSLEDGDQLKRNSEKINVPDIPTGEDAFPQRLRLSHEGDPPELSSQVPNIRGSDMPFPPPPSAPETTNIAQRHPSIGTNTVPPPLLPTITRAPVRYKFPDPPSEIPASEAELVDALQSESRDQKEEHGEEQADNTSRSLRPGQKGFAERLMSKYGWSKGSGLGATGTGIVNPLRVQVEKQSKKPDSEGGGFVVPGGRGKIVGGKKKGGPVAESDEGKFGAMSEVVVLRGMVAGMDLDAEMEGTEGGIMQEIGDECGEKVGLGIISFLAGTCVDTSSTAVLKESSLIAANHPKLQCLSNLLVNYQLSGYVELSFMSSLSANLLQAVNALEGRIFNGNTISARFFNKDKFETGNYE